MDLDDFFGKMPQRPDHPDFWKLVAVVMKLDAVDSEVHSTEQEAEAAWMSVLAEVGIDQTSLLYMANQRAMLSLGVTTVGQMLARMDEVTRLTVVWVDAFSAGVLYERGAL